MESYINNIDINMIMKAEAAAHTIPLNECDDFECELCGIRDCPFGHELHYHHDGCPKCKLTFHVVDFDDQMINQ
jgi:hypothetical protein